MLKGKRTSKLAWTVLAFAAAIPAAVSQPVVARTSGPVQHSDVQQVVDALALAGVKVAPDQIEFLSGIRSTKESASIQVVSTSNSSAGTVKVKLRCQDNRECLPFYVLVHSLDNLNVGSTRLKAVSVVEADVPQNVIRGGEHATLVLESPDSRMSLPVICLQSGVVGQTIRVASPDHRQLFDAVVIAPGMLKGSL
jgi:flagella basal body P-ring formation protein FlgA